MLNINDIKPLEEIPDYSIYIYYGAIFLIILLVLSALYILYNFFKNKKNTPQKEYLKILKNINFNDPKKASYTLSKYGAKLANDQRQKDLLHELDHILEKYKYKKEVPSKIDPQTKALYETFMESLDV